MAQLAVEVVDVSKRFKLYHEKSLKERVIRLHRRTQEDFWALRDVSLDVREGETFGFLGHNGSGKSTLLKCIGGILQPTAGLIRVRGRVASLLELGAGFHPDLTGRENVFINGSILGLPKAEIARRFDDIVAFAELEAFIDNQVKHYSSGMYVRLAFAVAVNVEPDVLLIDEVLAVGDESFQQKCLERVTEFQREGRTIVVVSHSADLMRQLCNQIAVLDHGRMVACGSPGDSIRTFREYLYAGRDRPVDEVVEPAAKQFDDRLNIVAVHIEHANQHERKPVRAGEALSIRVLFETKEPVPDAVVWLSVYDRSGKQLFGIDTDHLGIDIPPLDGHAEVTFTIPAMPLLDGDYQLSISCRIRGTAKVFDYFDRGLTFSVLNDGPAVGIVSFPITVSVDASGTQHSRATSAS